ncbi:histidinol phosphate aminotransferase [Salipiger abyssi]|uniref:histidinol phosphate aminotransferase n=1 Tax=Salipiger abyssi TaxID=1250539 RepID=UPI001A8DB6D4|nr:histidinol phosphate aminotransferase [Salipiger abyssi]MBN9885845.1 histidinol phosphate aminotransferase [Salipiger abyssi]
MDDRTRQPAPDFTTPALVFLFINMLWIFAVLWVQWGLGAVLLLGLAVNHLITRLERRLRRRG